MALEPVYVLCFRMKCLLLTNICDFDQTFMILQQLQCENENKKYSDVFLFFQLGENSKGTDHFPSWEQFSEEQIFKGTVH